MEKKHVAGASAAGGGGGIILDQWDTINSADWTMLPLFVLLSYLAVVGLAYFAYSLHKRVKALEAKTPTQA